MVAVGNIWITQISQLLKGKEEAKLIQKLSLQKSLKLQRVENWKLLNLIQAPDHNNTTKSKIKRSFYINISSAEEGTKSPKKTHTTAAKQYTSIQSTSEAQICKRLPQSSSPLDKLPQQLQGPSSPGRIHCRFLRLPKGTFPSDPCTYSSQTTSTRTRSTPTMISCVREQDHALPAQGPLRPSTKALQDAWTAEHTIPRYQRSQPVSSRAPKCTSTSRARDHSASCLTKVQKTQYTDWDTQWVHIGTLQTSTTTPALMVIVPQKEPDQWLSICADKQPMEKLRDLPCNLQAMQEDRISAAWYPDR